MAAVRAFGLALVATALVVSACSSGGNPNPSGSAIPAPAGGSAAPGASGVGGPGQASAPVAPSAGRAAGAMPCDALGPIVTQVTGLSIASVDATSDDCSFTVNTSGSSSADGLGGVVDIRMESDEPADLDPIDRPFVGGVNAIDVQGVGEKAIRNQSGSLMYAVHNGHVWAVQQEVLVSGLDLPGNATKLMQALFGLV